jgi:hypothetical protein
MKQNPVIHCRDTLFSSPYGTVLVQYSHIGACNMAIL